MVNVVLAGGKGVRLWPESREKRPKQLCDFFGQGSLVAMTLRRLRPLGATVVVCAHDQIELIGAEIGHLWVDLLGEPRSRITAPAVGLVLAAKNLPRNEVLGVFPADHFINDDAEFRRVVEKAAELLGCSRQHNAPGQTRQRPGG